jgi:Arabinose efflux permease
MVEGAVFPIIALTARHVGASVAEAGLIVALTGVGALLNNIPASILTARFGERRAMVGAALLLILALMLCVSAESLVMLAIGVFMIGMSQAVFLLARQTYLSDVVPLSMRARALSTLGGVMRIGLFISPFISAAFMQMMGLDGAYWLGAVAAGAAGALALSLPELHARQKPASNSGSGASAPLPPLSTGDIIRQFRHTFLTLGVGCLLVAALRNCRPLIIPLWAAHIGLDAATTSVIYGSMGAIDMLLFYPAGKLMDQYGRRATAVPSLLTMSVALAMIPFTTSLIPFLLATMLLGLGNGMGAGLVMTIGADSAPVHARARFLGVWRLTTDLGSCGGPLLVSSIAAAATLSTSVLFLSVAGFAASAVFFKWLPSKPAH